MPPDVLEAPVIDMSADTSSVDDSSVDTSTDTSTDSPSTESAETTSPETNSTDTPGEVSSDDSPEVFANGRLTQGATKALNQISKTHPLIAKQLKIDSILASNLRNTFPGGLREAATFQKIIKDAGGPQAIQQQREQLGFFSELDQAFTNADPKFIDALTDPEIQPGQSKSPLDSFKAIGPKLIEKYLSIDPEAAAVLITQNLANFAETNPGEHSAYMCHVMSNDMMRPIQELGGQSFVSIVNLMNALPDDSPKHAELRAALTAYGQRIFKGAEQPFQVKRKAQPETPKGPDPRETQLQEDRRKFEQEKSEATFNGWVADTRKERVDMFASEIDRLTKGMNVSDQRRAAILELARVELQRKIDGTPNFNAPLTAFFQNRDKSGYLKHLKMFYSQNIPKIASNVVGTIIDRPRNGAPKAAAAATKAPVANNGTPRPQARPTVSTDTWESISSAPNTSDVNLHASRGMIRQQKAILKNGRRVQW